MRDVADGLKERGLELLGAVTQLLRLWKAEAAGTASEPANVGALACLPQTRRAVGRITR
jgi:hypothetical protein